MSTLDDRAMVTATTAATASDVQTTRPEAWTGTFRGPDRVVYSLTLGAGLVGLLVGSAAFLADAADVLTPLALVLLAAGSLAPIAIRARAGARFGELLERERGTVLLAGLSIAGVVVVMLLPTWSYGGQVNGIIHRSAFSAPLVVLLAAFVAGAGLRGLLGNTPTSQDIATYPVLAVPIVLALGTYLIVLGQAVVNGIGHLSIGLLTTAWASHLVEANGTAAFQYDVGLRNNIIGTLELILLTSAFAILPGVGAGMFVSEYPGMIARAIEFATTMLRAVSVFVLGAVAFGLVAGLASQAPGSFLSQVIQGVSFDDNGLAHPGSGSFILASAILALLVIPVIAKLTEEGLRSVPREIREGSVALGATEGYGLRRILLPWAGLNIVTGLLLGAAEASGSLAVILLIAGTGQDGVGPTNSVTSLDYALFATRYGIKPYIDTMAQYGFTTALLLLGLTLGLTVLALVVRRRVGSRYRGNLTAK